MEIKPWQGKSYSRVKPCGTLAAYRRHLRHGEHACEDCLRAERRAQADRRAAAGARVRMYA